MSLKRQHSQLFAPNDIKTTSVRNDLKSSTRSLSISPNTISSHSASTPTLRPVKSYQSLSPRSLNTLNLKMFPQEILMSIFQNLDIITLSQICRSTAGSLRVLVAASVCTPASDASLDLSSSATTPMSSTKQQHDQMIQKPPYLAFSCLFPEIFKLLNESFLLPFTASSSSETLASAFNQKNAKPKDVNARLLRDEISFLRYLQRIAKSVQSKPLCKAFGTVRIVKYCTLIRDSIEAVLKELNEGKKLLPDVTASATLTKMIFIIQRIHLLATVVGRQIGKSHASSAKLVFTDLFGVPKEKLPFPLNKTYIPHKTIASRAEQLQFEISVAACKLNTEKVVIRESTVMDDTQHSRVCRTFESSLVKGDAEWGVRELHLEFTAATLCRHSMLVKLCAKLSSLLESMSHLSLNWCSKLVITIIPLHAKHSSSNPSSPTALSNEEPFTTAQDKLIPFQYAVQLLLLTLTSCRSILSPHIELCCDYISPAEIVQTFSGSFIDNSLMTPIGSLAELPKPKNRQFLSFNLKKFCWNNYPVSEQQGYPSQSMSSRAYTSEDILSFGNMIFEIFAQPHSSTSSNSPASSNLSPTITTEAASPRSSDRMVELTVLEVFDIRSEKLFSFLEHTTTLKELRLRFDDSWKLNNKSTRTMFEGCMARNQSIEKVKLDTTYSNFAQNEDDNVGFVFFRTIAALPKLSWLTIEIPFYKIGGLWNPLIVSSFYIAREKRPLQGITIKESSKTPLPTTCTTDNFINNLLNDMICRARVEDKVKFKLRGISVFQKLCSLLPVKAGPFKLQAFEVVTQHSKPGRENQTRFHFLIHSDKIDKISLIFTSDVLKTVENLEKDAEVERLFECVGILCSIEKTFMMKQLSMLKVSPNICITRRALTAGEIPSVSGKHPIY